MCETPTEWVPICVNPLLNHSFWWCLILGGWMGTGLFDPWQSIVEGIERLKEQFYLNNGKVRFYFGGMLYIILCHSQVHRTGHARQDSLDPVGGVAKSTFQRFIVSRCLQINWIIKCSWKIIAIGWISVLGHRCGTCPTFLGTSPQSMLDDPLCRRSKTFQIRCAVHLVIRRISGFDEKGCKSRH
jgi:hypothetical protein